MISIKTRPEAELIDCWSVQNGGKQTDFYIAQARIEDASGIITMAQEAYYNPEVEVLRLRDFSLKKEFGVDDVPRRIQSSDAYTVFVCKVKGESEDRSKDQIVGTAYYQRKNSDYVDENGNEVAEFGMLAVDPLFQRVNNIGIHFLQIAEKQAIKEGKRGMYLYVKGTRNDAGVNSSGLIDYYEKKGKYEFVANRQSSKQKFFGNKSVNMVLMLRNLASETSQTKIKTLQNKKQTELHKILE